MSNLATLLLAALACLAPRPFAQDPAAQDDPAPPAPARPAGGAPPSDDAFKMGSPPALQDGLTEQEMWPAATAAGWKLPCLVRWQRTFDDALRVARAERRPILVCVNMDGEIASEHFAGVRYRQPETAALMSSYVCVIASVYRHTPRDYDEEGRRVACPRFGTVTCGEHVEAERELYERYFDGMRVSPRHIVLGLDAAETLNVFYSWDTATVFTTFKKGVEGWPEPLELVEPTLVDRAHSASVEDREVLERAYADGDRAQRAAILRTLIEKHTVDQTEVLRAAVFGLDLELAGLARRALAQCETEGSLDLMAEALKAPLEASDRELLLDAVRRLGKTSPRARTLAALHSGLSLDSALVAKVPEADLAREYQASARRDVDVQARATRSEEHPEDPAALLALAEALVARSASEPDRRLAALLMDDARNAAERAEVLGLASARLSAMLALTADAEGDVRDARGYAVRAVEGGLLAEPEDPEQLGEVGRVRLLTLFCEAREQAIRAAFRSGEAWPPEWLSDVNAAYARIAESPLVDDAVLVGQHDFLRWIGATPRADAALDDALARFPDSNLVHDRLRARLLWEGGPAGLERGYAELVTGAQAAGGGPTQITWFAGYASLVAAEHHRRRSELDEALAAYERGIARFQTNAAAFPDGRESCDHFAALALAGRARVALERGEFAVATDELLAGMRRSPDASATLDGLGITPIATARMLQARLRETGAPGDEERAARVQAALDTLDPRLLEPPPSERPDLGRRRRRG
jgi:hypothetical protein